MSTERLIVAKRTTAKARTAQPTRTTRRFWNYPRPNVRGIRRWLPSWRIVVGTFLTMVGLVAGVGAAAYMSVDAPTGKPQPKDQTSSIYWGDATTKLADLYTEKRTDVEYSTLPRCDGSGQVADSAPGLGEACIANAVVASEDQQFWTNAGVDPKGILRAAVNNLSGGSQQGASTLTQQYVETYYDRPATTYVGKAKEIITAHKITRVQSKQQIIGNYLNTIYFGRGAYGIQAASQAYFGVDAGSLTPSQAAWIAGIIPSPNRYDTKETGPEWAAYRWQRTLEFMAEGQFITSAQFDEAIAAGGPVPIDQMRDDRYREQQGYLITLVENELEREFEKLGIPIEDIKGGGLQIYTTFDATMQNEAVATMQSVREQDPAPSNFLHGALVSIDPATGALRAVYGGDDFMTVQWNDAVNGGAQAASTFKPFTLIAALEDGASLNEVYDGHNKMQLPGWEKPVRNFGDANYGSMTLTEATAKSVNTVYAQLNNEVTPAATADVAARLGIKTELSTYASNVLGADTVHPVELANAYATIAAQGQYHQWHVVQKVLDKDGNTIFDAGIVYPAVSAIDAEVANGATYAMRQVIEMQGGSGDYARRLKRPAAGKTGSSNDNKSAWFAGYTPDLVTVVSLFQYPDDGSQGQASITKFGKWREITGGSWPVEAWTSYMGAVLEGRDKLDFPEYTPTKPRKVPSPSPSVVESLPPEEVVPEPTVPTVEGVMVPALTGATRQDAINQLEALGLHSVTTLEYHPTAPLDTVISVGSQGQVPPGSTISITVSRGPDPAVTPAAVQPGGGG